MTYGTAATVKAIAGLTHTDLGLASDAAYDTYINAVMAGVSEEIDRYCGTGFALHENDTDHVRGQGRPVLRLTHRPIIEIHEVKEGGVVVEADEYFIRRVPLDTVNSGAIEKRRGFWYPGALVEVEYDWGYPVVPGDVTQVAQEMAVMALQSAASDRVSVGVSSVSMGGYSVSYGGRGSMEGARLAVLMRLLRYRQVVVG